MNESETAMQPSNENQVVHSLPAEFDRANTPANLNGATESNHGQRLVIAHSLQLAGRLLEQDWPSDPEAQLELIADSLCLCRAMTRRLKKFTADLRHAT